MAVDQVALRNLLKGKFEFYKNKPENLYTFPSAGEADIDEWTSNLTTNPSWSNNTFKPFLDFVRPEVTSLFTPDPQKPFQLLPQVDIPKFDPLLSTQKIYDQGQAAIDAASAPVDINNFVAPQVPLLVKGVTDQLKVAQSSAISNATNSGFEKSSRTAQDVNVSLPAQAQQAIADGIVKLTTSAYPLALQEKQMIIDTQFKGVGLTMQLRQMIGDEGFKALSLNQQNAIANKDAELRLKLADLDMKFRVAMKKAEFEFTNAQNEADRDIKRQEMAYLKSERERERKSAWIGSLAAIGGAFLGASAGPQGMLAGAYIGQTVGKGFSDSFDLG